MTVLVPPWPDPPLFVAYIREEPLPSNMHQGYSVQIIRLEDKQCSDRCVDPQVS